MKTLILALLLATPAFAADHSFFVPDTTKIEIIGGKIHVTTNRVNGVVIRSGGREIYVVSDQAVVDRVIENPVLKGAIEVTDN